MSSEATATPVASRNDAFDLSGIDTVEFCNKGAEIEIKHPVTGAGLGVFIEVRGADSNVFRDASRRVANDNLRRQKVALRQGKEDEETIEQTLENNIATLAAATAGWRTVVNKDTGDSEPYLLLNGEKVTFSVDNARKVYAKFPVLYRQVNEGIGNLENFMSA